jgi:Ca2+-binding EF-hand superfamily protein
MTVAVRGRNLFDLLDTDSDNQLDRRELLAARQLIAIRDRISSTGKITPEDIPLSLLIGISRGPAGGRFARLRMARRLTEPSTQQMPKANVPRWFTAMDRNRDQFLSPSEFIGPIHQFNQLDRNSDGMIASDETVDSE